MTDIQRYHVEDEPISDSIALAADRIEGCIGDLKARWDRLGTRTAFDPHDQGTKALFDKLWAHSFKPQYPPPVQDRILHALSVNHPDAIQMMRDIGHVSEIEMEKGHARFAIEIASHVKDPPTDQAHKYIRRRMTLQLMLAEANDQYQAASGAEDDDAIAHASKLRHIAADAVSDYLNERAAGYNVITKDFPYKTYQNMSHAENLMLTGLRELGPNRQFPGTHLIIEAGALPETAIYSSISRMHGHVLAVISDKESFALAEQLIKQLERLLVIVPGTIRLLHADPFAPDFKERISEALGDWEPPYAATITQLVQGRDRVEQLARTLIEEHGIDTLVVRGAHQMTRLLYEPVNDLKLPGGVRSRFTAVPRHGTISDDDIAGNDEVVQHERMCYNTSHVYSSRMPNRDVALSSMSHIFAANGHALSA